MHYTGKKHLEALTRNGVVVSMVARGRGRAGISGSGFTRGLQLSQVFLLLRFLQWFLLQGGDIRQD